MRCLREAYGLAVFAALATGLGCSAQDDQEMAGLQNLCGFNVYDEINPTPGRVVRFDVPIAIFLNGSEQARVAINNLEQATDGKVRFMIASEPPVVGIIVSEGDAVDADGAPGCGNVTNEVGPGVKGTWSSRVKSKMAYGYMSVPE